MRRTWDQKVESSNAELLIVLGIADPPFSYKSVVSFTHEQNIICSKTLICRQLFAGHVVGSRPMKKREKCIE